MKIGLLVSRSGPAGLWGPSSEAGAILAAAELNASGGVLGTRVDLVVRDAGWTDRAASEAAADLLEIEDADVIVGMHPSNVRAAIGRRLGGRIPYIYTPQYEGGERSPNVLTTGGTDPEMLAPAIDWLAGERRARRFFLIGNDYVWPKAAHGSATHLIHRAGGRVVGDLILPFGRFDHDEALSRIRRTRADVVLMSLLGDEAVAFNRSFAEAGLAASVLRFGLATDETVLHGIGADHTENLHAALTYFAHIRTSANGAFLETYFDAFGERAPPPNVFCQSCYDGIHAAAGLARRVGRTEGRLIATATRRPVERRVIRGPLTRSPMGQTLRAYIAEAHGIEFRPVRGH